MIIVYRKDLGQPLTAHPARVPVDIAVATDEQVVARLAALAGGDEREAALYARRMRRGQRCFVAWVGDEPAGFNWLATADEADEDRTIRLRAGEVYCFDAYTAPEWRGHAVHPALLARMLEVAQAEGYATAFTQVGRARWASRKTHQRLDWTVTGRLLHVRLPFRRRSVVLRLSGSAHPIAHMQR